MTVPSPSTKENSSALRYRDPLRQARYELPTTILYGVGILEQLPQLLGDLRVSNPLVITDRGLGATPIPARITTVLNRAGIEHGLFQEVESDPSTELVDALAALLRERGHDSVIGLGGGSAMDAAKAAAAAATANVPVTELVGPERVQEDPLPIIAVPTTAGPGSEVTRFAVLSDKSAGAKVSIASMKIMPKYALLEPELTLGLPAPLTAGTGLDALSHAIESYGSVWNNPVSEGMALHAISLIGQHLRTATNDPSNVVGRAGMLAASCIAELAANATRLGLAHALAVPLGATHGVPHGLAVGMMLPPMCAFNEEVEPARYRTVAAALDPEAKDLSEALSALYADIGMTARLRDFGVEPDSFDRVLDLAERSDNVQANPRIADREELRALLQEAY
ncbi:iron-containing alcohol dehydrogenase family protein [Arthrobacter subterraneus]|uniref:iron-containing alcohol dehydrogenase family protein n=1 Tax=Arthrobacter subterraneus TaxID=335973 RepID=UPI003815066D